MPANQTQRPKFYEEQYLGAADLTAAVDYGRVQQARHVLGAHTWGIAIGLQLKETLQPGGAVSVHLLPGYAWDGYGRPIVVLSPYKIPEEKFSAIKFDASIDTDGKGRLIPIWLRYDESATQNPRPGFEVCETADQYSRIQETFRIEIGDQQGTMDRYTGITVAAKSLTDAKTALQAFDATAPLVYDESIPHQALPEPQDRARWLIPIGYVRWLPGSPGHFVARDDKGGAEKDSDKIRSVRRYIGVVAEEIEAADGVIRLRDRGKDPQKSFFQAPLTVTDPTHPPVNDLVWVEGSMRVLGDVKLCAGKLDFRDQHGEESKKAPLRIQRTETEDEKLSVSALQVTIGDLSTSDLASPINHRFSVGPLGKDGTVNERFVVLSNGNIGIGTSNPTTPLHIMGTRIRLEKDGKRLDMRTDGDAVDLQSETDNIYIHTSGSGGKNNVIINPASFNGNVGIGTTSPVSKLEVAGDVAIEKITSEKRRELPSDATMLWNDGSWLHLNENFNHSKPIFGVYTPLFASDSLKVGGDTGDLRDPGSGNVWVKGRVGIGTTTPRASLQVSGGAIMPALGNSATAGILFPSDPSGGIEDEAFIRYFAVKGETPKLLIGVNKDGDGTIGFYQFGDQRMTIRSGNVGIGTTDPQNLLHVEGNASKPGGGNWTNKSDANLKKNIEPLTDALSKLLQLRGVRFKWKEPEKMGNLTGPQMGLVAQEVEGVFPEWISTSRDGYMQLTIRGFEALTVEAFRELHTEIEALKMRLDKLTENQPIIEARPRKQRSRKETTHETRD